MSSSCSNNNYNNNRQRKNKSSSSSSSSSFSLLKMFKSGSTSNRRHYDPKEFDQSSSYVQAYKVYPSDEDRAGWWVAEPGIDQKASAYISLTTDKWEKLAVAN